MDVKNAPLIRALDVDCPECASVVGERCVSSVGASTNPHRGRRRIATRRALETRQEHPAEFIWTLSPGERKRLRLSSGQTLASLADVFGVDMGKVRRVESGERLTRDAFTTAYGAWLRVWSELS